MKDFDLKVLGAVASYCAEHDGKGPSVREVGIAIGYPHPKEVWQSLLRLEAVGVITWPIDGRGRRAEAGLRLNVPIKEPVRVPILGPLDGKQDYTPGSRYLEWGAEGIILVEPDGTRKRYEIVAPGWE